MAGCSALHCRGARAGLSRLNSVRRHRMLRPCGSPALQRRSPGEGAPRACGEHTYEASVLCLLVEIYLVPGRHHELAGPGSDGWRLVVHARGRRLGKTPGAVSRFVCARTLCVPGMIRTVFFFFFFCVCVCVCVWLSVRGGGVGFPDVSNPCSLHLWAAVLQIQRARGALCTRKYEAQRRKLAAPHASESWTAERKISHARK